MMGVQKVIHIQQIFYPFLINGIGSWFFFYKFLSTLYNIYFSYQGRLSFRGFFDFPKFFYNFCKKKFFVDSWGKFIL